MKITKTYKYKPYQSNKNEKLHQQIDIAGLIYNHCIALHKRYYKLTGKHLNKLTAVLSLTSGGNTRICLHWIKR